jgi:hypothetical protein
MSNDPNWDEQREKWRQEGIKWVLSHKLAKEKPLEPWVKTPLKAGKHQVNTRPLETNEQYFERREKINKYVHGLGPYTLYGI